MAETTLVAADVDLGRQLLADLEADGIKISLAFWAKLEEFGDWRFFVASPDLDELGLFQAYGRIAAAGHAEHVFNNQIVTVLSMSDPLIVGLQRSFQSQNGRVRGQKLTNLRYWPHLLQEGLLERVA